ncbi:alpha/beta hydrolase-fold protein [Gelidibacter salicanalis]|uniref:Alpha/beta hydrolase n=1 Tax=Gelidibacter salicanalis TaxID=291193 RepID=A0A934KWH1_9FLAO|nr:alpha/beta hydrolase-fold protein [Gelidibacter salicanalis]MBJ7880630.1 alpha/beta hydrolase [Gelidibacter salicanalis]
MKNYIGFVFIILSFMSCKQSENSVKLEQPKNDIVIGQLDSMYSTILGESREFWIHIPKSAKDNSSYKTQYPVLYLLDGPSHFSSVTGMIEQLSPANGNMSIPEMIVVGIANTNRSLDFTPSQVDIDFISGDSLPFASGGGNKFLDFLEMELIPHVEKTYPASHYRTFVGHSFGGLSVINALADRQHLFNKCIAIDPSLWWDNRAFLIGADSILSIHKFKGKALYLGVANTLEAGMTIDKVQSDGVPDTNFTVHIKSILQFADSLEVKKDNELLFEWKHYDNDDHGSVPLIAEYDALRFLFSWYKLEGVNDFFSENSTLTAEDLLKIIDTHYAKISDKFGYTVIPTENFINSIGNGFMYNEMPDKAYALLILNIKNYPKSANVYETLGDYYLFQSDTLNAIKQFKKGYIIENKEQLKIKLEALAPEQL